MIELSIFKDDFQKILNCLHCGGMFNHSIISFKHDSIFSIQEEKHAKALLYLRYFSHNHRCSMTKGTVKSIEVNIAVLIYLIKEIPDGTLLKVRIDGKRLIIHYGNDNIEIYYKTPDKVITELPFEIRDGIPLVGKNKAPLNTRFTMLTSDLKKAVKASHVLKTECFGFILDRGKLTLQVGDLEDQLSDKKTFHFSVFDCKGNAKVMLTYGISQIAEAFGKYVKLNMRTDSGAWFIEETDDYVLGVLIPSCNDEE